MRRAAALLCALGAAALGRPARAAGAAVPTGGAPAAGGGASGAAQPSRPAAGGLPRATAAPEPRGGIREAAPRPVAVVRVQDRYASKAKLTQLFGGADYLSRGDFYVSPGVRVGATYYSAESLGLELQVSHFFSRLTDEAQRVRRTLGAIPDSHAPEWLFLAGARYSIGYGKLMVGGADHVLHFEPQAFVHVGAHANDGDFNVSADGGLGLLFFVTPRLFARLDTAVVYERETRSGAGVSVLGLLPALSLGGVL